MHPEEFREMESLEEDHWWFRGKRLLLDSILAQLGDGRIDRILDVGCGTGGVAKALAARATVVGIDGAEVALRFCREKGVGAVVRGSVLALPFAAASFDVCVMLDVLEHLDDEQPLLAEIRRVLRPGGAAVVSVPAFQSLWSQHDETFEHRRRYRRAELEHVMAAAGFHVAWASYTNCAVFLPALAWRTLRRRARVAPGMRTDFFSLPKPLNRALVEVYRGEATVLRRHSLPFGVSVACVARR